MLAAKESGEAGVVEHDLTGAPWSVSPVWASAEEDFVVEVGFTSSFGLFLSMFG